jgi:hypothetical protein
LGFPIWRLLRCLRLSIHLITLFFFITVCAVVLTVVMGVRYVKTRKIMPAGIIAAIRFVQISLVYGHEFVAPSSFISLLLIRL